MVGHNIDVKITAILQIRSYQSPAWHRQTILHGDPIGFAFPQSASMALVAKPVPVMQKGCKHCMR